MYLHKLKKPNGDIYLSIKEKYHVPGKGAREKTVKSLGYVSELQKTYEDPIVYFSQMAAEMTAQKKKEQSVRIFIDTTAKMSTDVDDVKNVGYGVLKELYTSLKSISSGTGRRGTFPSGIMLTRFSGCLSSHGFLRPLQKRAPLRTGVFTLKTLGIFPLMMSTML